MDDDQEQVRHLQGQNDRLKRELDESNTISLMIGCLLFSFVVVMALRLDSIMISVFWIGFYGLAKLLMLSKKHKN